VIELEYEVNHRRCALLLLLSLSTLSWIAMVTVRLVQIDQSIEVSRTNIQKQDHKAAEYELFVHALVIEFSFSITSIKTFQL